MIMLCLFMLGITAYLQHSPDYKSNLIKNQNEHTAGVALEKIRL